MHWFEITLIMLVLGFHLYAALSAPHNFSMRWFTRDDAFYYFKVAQNISEGHGSSFDGLNLTNGYHPLWMLVCIPIFSLARFDLILPLRILIMVMAALSAATSILLFRLLKKHTGEALAMLAASFWAFNLNVHAIVTQQGMETGLLALSIVLFLRLIQNTQNREKLTPRDLILLASAAVFVVLSRLDGIFLILIAGLWLIFRRTPLRTLLPLDLLLTFSVVVGAYLQRAGLKFYLLDFDTSAILMASLTFSIQTVVFYFVGLYTHPKNLLPVRLLLITVIGVSLSALIVSFSTLALAKTGLVELPRAVPALYWLGMLAATLLSRFSLRLLSPWPAALSKDYKPILGFLAGRNQVQIALQPIKKWLKSALIYYGITGTALLLYMLGNRFLFGTFMPVSGQIKRWWGSIPNDVYGGGAQTILDVFALDPKYSQAWRLVTRSFYDWSRQLAALGWTPDLTYNTWYWLIAGIFTAVLVGLLLVNRKKNLRRIFMLSLFPLLISAQLQAFSYGATAYAAKQEWYWVMQMLALLMVLALGLARPAWPWPGPLALRWLSACRIPMPLPVSPTWTPCSSWKNTPNPARSLA
jgi:hypothetical protein